MGIGDLDILNQCMDRLGLEPYPTCSLITYLCTKDTVDRHYPYVVKGVEMFGREGLLEVLKGVKQYTVSLEDTLKEVVGDV